MSKNVPYIGLAAEPIVAKQKLHNVSNQEKTPDTRDSINRISTENSRKSKTKSRPTAYSDTKRSKKCEFPKTQKDEARQSIVRAKKLLNTTDTVQIKD